MGPFFVSKQYTGYHGTHINNEAPILKNGFNLSVSTEKRKHFLGNGVYFFEDCCHHNGLDEAKAFAKNVSNIAEIYILVLKSELTPVEVLDLADNPDDIKKFDAIRDLLRLKIKYSEKESNKIIIDYDIFFLMDKTPEKYPYDLIRAQVDAAKMYDNHFSYIIKRAQIQICVKKLSIIGKPCVVWKHRMKGYNVWHR
jgi:hypothetical protein